LELALITLRRPSVQSYVEISLFPLDETLLPSAANNTFRNYRVRDSLQNEVLNEEGCGANNPDCSDTVYGCGHSRGAGARRYLGSVFRPQCPKVYILSFRTHDDRRPSKFIVLADNMKSAIKLAWEHGGSDFRFRFDKSTAEAEQMKEGALRVL
jgi:hypothetical protein